ncbi:hypothetical protein GobsT_08920 [Gemmata obscuriglobus]|uniref:DUF1501 domain-containing protein n=1 Tax=Gemmata obscuriglobus TaxID=114 RepID=A0A2Z3HAN8_9BACT|nr:DUF1501 domain-containing protein [Gemmata obscuriglobus]AWM40587.1 DUF1501 domain-containing protein [Gemmata obscuriglobus]QEG26153.1 hypothetical protein GobsT_08920 [Gemmata obscuriglobus]VTS00742.1 hypothetical protein : Uncharacterized protein OS=Singulisphaera acidiphila (strain ATCC BAA-1392 / DSM 18658 / VKM B-2454 / MOB10) GN=Sinac_1252 PE=4 SV=1: DUF1501 [Gemmata obscuriglobus UQM 2246]
MSLLSHLARRDFLKLGAGAAVGLALPRPALASTEGKAKQVILVNLTGGLSHLDSLDMKPEAPAEVRGEFTPRQTTLPGVQICEHLPLLAARMRHWALVRSLSHGENGHLPGTHRLLTGSTMPNQRQTDLDNVLSRRDWPCYAAGLNHLRPRKDGIPNGVVLPHALIEGPLTWPGQHAGFLGPGADPMLVAQDPSAPNFKMDAFALPDGTDPVRVEGRRGLLEQLESTGTGDPAFRDHQRRAFELLNSGRVAGAFRLDREPNKIRDRYGRNQFGQSLLLARRLIESGVPIVQANMGIVQSWDTHVDNWGKLKTRLLPWLDQSLAALVDELDALGRLSETLVVVSGEFGRTPKVSTLPGETIPGRDHWARVYSGLFAGGGVVGGRVIGKSDRSGTSPVTTSYTPFDIGATIYRALGVDPESEIRDPQNRPTRVCPGTPMDILFQNK